MPIIPNGPRLRHFREQQEYTLNLLAEVSGVGEKTIRNIETGITKLARVSTLKSLCAVLEITVDDISINEESKPVIESRTSSTSCESGCSRMKIEAGMCED